MSTAFASHAGKTVMQDSAVQITINYLLDVGAEKTVPPLEPVVIDHFECLEMVLYALVVWRVLGIALSVYGFRHGLFHSLASGNKTMFHRNTHAGLNKGLKTTICSTMFLERTRLYRTLLDRSNETAHKIMHRCTNLCAMTGRKSGAHIQQCW